jgi:hypothetical protein
MALEDPAEVVEIQQIIQESEAAVEELMEEYDSDSSFEKPTVPEKPDPKRGSCD